MTPIKMIEANIENINKIKERMGLILKTAMLYGCISKPNTFEM